MVDRPNPGEGVTGGEGKEEWELHWVKAHLWVVLEREEVVRGGGSTAGGGWRRCCATVAAFRRGVEMMAGPGSFVGTRANGFGGWWASALARAAARRGWVAMAMAAWRVRQQRAEGEGVRVANEKASSREFRSGRRGARRVHGRRRGQLGHGDHAQG